MKSFVELTGREKLVELLRWVLVLPAAVLGAIAARFVSGLVSRLAVYAGGTAAESEFVYYVQFLLYYFPKEAAFVIVGAMLAPRRRLAIAPVLAIAGILMSLIVHILGQPAPRLLNYTHFTAESAGAALGLAYIFFSERMNGRTQ